MINRNNYEEYLLMYLDGELSPTDLKAVESFLENNPDLKEELKLLEQTKLNPEEAIAFSAKESLYRKTEGITINNYEEYFLLYIDNELPSNQMELVETFVLQHPELQDNFTLLKQTVLPSEHIVFNNKKSLYRKEEKKRPVVISLRWASLAAAVMIGAIAFVIFNNPGKTDPVARKVTTPGTNNIINVKPQQVLPIIVPEENKEMAAQSTGNKENQRLLIPSKDNNQDVSTIEQPLALEKQTIEPSKAVSITEPVITVNHNAVPAESVTATDPGETKIVNTASTTDNYVPQHAVFTESLEIEKDNNLYIGSLQVNTDKVRGLFRKATRFLSSKVKNNGENSEEKVQIANMELKRI